MFKYRVFIIKNKDQQNGAVGELIEITPIVHSYSMSSTKTNYAKKMDFSVVVGDSMNQLALSYIPINPVELGDIIQLTINDIEVFRGMIIQKSGDYSNSSINFGALDFGFYINKNEDTIKFYKKSAKECLNEIFTTFNYTLQTNEVPETVIITDIFKDKTLGTMIKEILKEVFLRSGNLFYLKVTQDYFEILETPKSKHESGVSQLSEYKISIFDNEPTFDFQKIIGQVNFDENIEDLKNVVKVILEKENKVTKSESKSKANKDGKKKNNPKIEKEVKKEIVDLKYKDKATNKSEEDIREAEQKVSSTDIVQKALVKSPESIEKYGYLQAVETVKADDVTSAEEFANNRLNELNRPKKTINIEIYNCPQIEPYQLIEFIEPKIGLNGVYEVQEVAIEFNQKNIKSKLKIQNIEDYISNEGGDI